MAKNKATWLCEQVKQRTWKRQGESIKSKTRYKRGRNMGTFYQNKCVDVQQ